MPLPRLSVAFIAQPAWLEFRFEPDISLFEADVARAEEILRLYGRNNRAHAPAWAHTLGGGIQYKYVAVGNTIYGGGPDYQWIFAQHEDRMAAEGALVVIPGCPPARTPPPPPALNSPDYQRIFAQHDARLNVNIATSSQEQRLAIPPPPIPRQSLAQKHPDANFQFGWECSVNEEDRGYWIHQATGEVFFEDHPSPWRRWRLASTTKHYWAVDATSDQWDETPAF